MLSIGIVQKAVEKGKIRRKYHGARTLLRLADLEEFIRERGSRFRYLPRPDKGYLTMYAAAKIARTTPPVVWRALRSGRLPGIKVVPRGDWMVAEEDLKNWIFSGGPWEFGRKTKRDLADCDHWRRTKKRVDGANGAKP